MKQYFRSELKRVLFSRRALFSLFIGIGILYVGFPKFEFIGNLSDQYDGVDMFFIIRDLKGFYAVIFPLLAAIIFSDSYADEKQYSFTNFIYTRIDIKEYKKVKVLVTGIVATIIGMITALALFLCTIFIFGIRHTTNFQTFGTFGFMYYSNKLIFALIYIIINGVCYGVMAELSLGLTAWIKNKYICLIIPFFYYIISASLFEVIGINQIVNLNFTCVFSSNVTMSEVNLIIYSLVLFIIGVGMFFIGVKNYEKDN